jgi:hypothetical protein
LANFSNSACLPSLMLILLSIAELLGSFYNN